MADTRKTIGAATQAALWALSNGRCYAPRCQAPVVVEVRAGVYRKNAQIGHIYGVRKGAPRYDAAVSDQDRDSFANLVLVCLPHHAEIDDPRTGAQLYPWHVLRQWKDDHEASDGPALASLGPVTDETIADLLTAAFTPPIERLKSIADQLEQTGTLNAGALLELREIVRVLADSTGGPDWHTAAIMHDAADVLGGSAFGHRASRLSDAADILGGSSFGHAALRLRDAADIFASDSFINAVAQLSRAADSLADSAPLLNRNRGRWSGEDDC